jgi:hypothetical protein
MGKAYIGTALLSSKGKIYGGVTRQVYGANRKEAIKKLKSNFKFGDNVVRVTKLKLASEVRKSGMY